MVCILPDIHNQWKSITGKLINQSIKTNRCWLVTCNWYRLVSANRWSVSSHIKLSASYIDCHQLLLITFLFPFSNQLKSIKHHRILSHQLLIDFQYQFINCHWLIWIWIDWRIQWLRTPGFCYHKMQNRPLARLWECNQSGGQNKRNFRFCKKILFCPPDWLHSPRRARGLFQLMCL